MRKWRMVCIGSGPGPKNVLCEDEQGVRTVVPYAIWKYKYKEEVVADKEYGTVVGFIQFPVEPRELDDIGEVRDVTVRSVASQELVRITFWPDFEDAELAEGDFIAVDGSVTRRTVGEREYTNVSARSLFLNGELIKPRERKVVKKDKPARQGF